MRWLLYCLLTTIFLLATLSRASGDERVDAIDTQPAQPLGVPFRIGFTGESATAGNVAHPGDANPPLRLAPPSKDKSDGGAAGPVPPTPGRAISTVLGSLAVVLGLFFLLMWFTRRALPTAATGIPKEVVEVLGRAPLSGRQFMHLVRIGNKLLLLSVTPNGTETLTEIDDPEEVNRVVTICQRNQPGSISQTFRHVLAQMGKEPQLPESLDHATRDYDELGPTEIDGHSNAIAAADA